MAYRYKTVKRGGKTKLLHRHIAEKKLGRPLLPHEHVHHGNEQRWDNRPDNLEAAFATACRFAPDETDRIATGKRLMHEISAYALAAVQRALAAQQKEVDRLRELADSEGTRAVKYLRRARQAEQAPPLQDLAMMIRMLASSLKRHHPNTDLPDRAMSLLKRHGLQGSPLRQDAAPQQAAPAADTRKPCTCDGAGRGPGRSCVVKAGGQLGELWRCADGFKQAAPATDKDSLTVPAYPLVATPEGERGPAPLSAWCSRCGCGNDAFGYAHLSGCSKPDMVQVTKEDAANYCRVLTALGMEEEGDPVAEIERLKSCEAAPDTVTPADGTLHADGYFSWAEGKRPAYLLDKGLPAKFWLAPTPQPQAVPLTEAQASEHLEIALGMLAAWCVAVDTNGAGWDDWDEHYKDAMHRPGPLRALLDKAIADHRTAYGLNDQK